MTAAAASAGAGGDASLVACVTLTVAGQLCGVPVTRVRDVLGDQPIARIPLAPPEVAGSLNLRGRIVTALDLRRRLKLPDRAAGAPRMALVTEQGAELYALLADGVHEVLDLSAELMEPAPPTLPPSWSAYAAGVARLDDRLLIVLDLDRLLALAPEEA